MKKIAALLCLVLLSAAFVGCASRELSYGELTERARLSSQLKRHGNFSCVYSTGVARGNVFVDKQVCIVDMSDTAMVYLPDGRGYLAQRTPEDKYSVLPIVNLLSPALSDKTGYEMFAAPYASSTEEIKSQRIENDLLTVETSDSLGISWEYVLDAGTLDMVSMEGRRDGEKVSQEWTNYKYDVETPESKQELIDAITAWEGLSDADTWVLTVVSVDDKGNRKEMPVKLKKGTIAYIAFGQNCGYSGLYADENGNKPVDIYSALDKQNDATVYAVYGK